MTETGWRSETRGVDLWLVPDDALSAGHALALVTDAEREWLDTVVAPRAREQRLRARAAVRSILAGYLQSPPRRIPLTRDRRGRPQLSGSSLEFSLSHTAGCTMVAVTRSGGLGVDVERRRPAPCGPLRRYLSVPEQRLLDGAGDTERDGVAVGLWTRKEAVAKATGRRVTELRALTLAHTGMDDRTQLEVGGTAVTVGPLRAGRDHVAALAVLGPWRGVRCRTWTP